MCYVICVVCDGDFYEVNYAPNIVLSMIKYSQIDCFYLSSYVRLYEMSREKQQGI